MSLHRLWNTLAIATAIALASCEEGSKNANQAPDSRIAIESINLTGEDRLNSMVQLSWYGTDQDGYVAGFELSFDNQNWSYTTAQDSTFLFSIGAGQDTVDIDFYLRAIDNENTRDPEPAYLRIPLKNSPPTARFDSTVYPQDSVHSILTYRWSMSDPDGVETIEAAFLKINDGNWYELNRSRFLFSLVPENPDMPGQGNAQIYYENDANPQSTLIDGFRVGDINQLYVKVVDIAGTESVVDSSNFVYVRPQTSDLLVVSGHPDAITAQYRSIVNQTYTASADFLDYAADNGAAQPLFWNPTFRLLANLYDKLIIHTNGALFTHPVSGQSGRILDFAAPIIQDYSNNGGKSLITTVFSTASDVSALVDVLPFDSIVTSGGQARISPDSTIFEVNGNTADYPSLSPSNLLFGLIPVTASADAVDFYKAELIKIGGWNGSNTIATKRLLGANVSQVFFALELHQFDQDPAALNDLFDQILNHDFNW